MPHARTEGEGRRAVGPSRACAEGARPGDAGNGAARAPPGGRWRDVPACREAPRHGVVFGRSRAAPRGPRMIAADTSSMVAFLEGAAGDDTEVIQSALDHQQLALPPVVLTELLSEPTLPKAVRTLLTGLPILDMEPGFWERAGLLRATVLKQKKKARVADALDRKSTRLNS